MKKSLYDISTPEFDAATAPRREPTPAKFWSQDYWKRRAESAEAFNSELLDLLKALRSATIEYRTACIESRAKDNHTARSAAASRVAATVYLADCAIAKAKGGNL